MCTDDADCARSEYNVIANLGIQMAIRPHTLYQGDHYSGNMYRSFRPLRSSPWKRIQISSDP